MNTPRHTEDDIARTEGLSSASLTRGVSRVRPAADLAVSAFRLPRVLLLIAGLFADSALTKARHALDDWQTARHARAHARRESRAGEYPGIDRPLTYAELRARRRRDSEQS